MGYAMDGSEAKSRIHAAKNEARETFEKAEQRKLTLEKAAEVVNGMQALGSDEATMAAFVDKILAESERGAR